MHISVLELLSAKVCSQRSGSWPFSLARSPRQQRFFPADSACPSTSSCPSDDNEFKEPARTISTNHNNNNVTKDLTPAAPSKSQQIRKQCIVHPDVSGRARSPSRERDFREAARHGAAAARRRFCNVVRAFRFSSVTRSSPNVADCWLSPWPPSVPISSAQVISTAYKDISLLSFLSHCRRDLLVLHLTPSDPIISFRCPHAYHVIVIWRLDLINTVAHMPFAFVSTTDAPNKFAFNKCSYYTYIAGRSTNLHCTR